MKRILFIGSDRTYYDKVVESLHQHQSGNTFHFLPLLGPRESTLQTLILQIVEIRPEIIFIDYSLDFKEASKLTHLLGVSYPLSERPIIGLLDKRPQDAEYALLMSSHLRFYLIKSQVGHHFDSLWSWPLQAYMGLESFPEIYSLEKQQEVLGVNFCKVGHVASQVLHIETQLDMELADELTVDAFPFAGAGIKAFQVVGKSRENLYYSFPWAYDLKWGPSSPGAIPVPRRTRNFYEKLELMESIRERESMATDESFIKLLSQNHKSLSQAAAKRTRVLIIDPAWSILQLSKRDLDQFPYSLRVSEHLDPQLEIIPRVLPGIICVILDGVALKDQAARKQGMLSIGRLIKRIKGMVDYHPILVFFNCPYQHDALTEAFAYDKIIVDQSGFNFELMIAYSTLYEQKRRTRNKGEDGENNGGGQCHYYDKSEPESVGKIEIPVVIRSMNESYVLLESSRQLPEEGKLSLRIPMDEDGGGEMTLQVFILPEAKWPALLRPILEGKSRKNQYVGIFFGHQEREKQEIRSHIRKNQKRYLSI